MVEVTKSDELDGLGALVADLLADNLAADPSRESLIKGKPWVVAIAVPEAESAFRITLGQGTITVAADAGEPSVLRITTDGDTLVELPEVPLVAGLPSPFTTSGRQLITKLLKRQLTIKGLLRHPLKVTHALRLLNTADLD